jgi:hypothetical protein
MGILDLIYYVNKLFRVININFKTLLKIYIYYLDKQVQLNHNPI